MLLQDYHGITIDNVTINDNITRCWSRNAMLCDAETSKLLWCHIATDDDGDDRDNY